MNFVFFDIECANTLNGEGKICSFGYVKTDENFNVIKKKDILINPDAVFLLGNVKTGKGITLAYPLFRFRNSYKFPYYYHEIYQLLADENNLIFGFAVYQDVTYVEYSCTRYNLVRPEYSFFDIQKLEQILHKKQNPSGLDHLIEQYQLPSFTYHRSDDDSLMTMEVFRALLKEQNLTAQECIEKYSSCLNNTKNLRVDIAERKKTKQKKAIIKQRKAEFYRMIEQCHSDVSAIDTHIWKKKIFFDHLVYDKELDELYRIAKIVIHKGGSIVSNPTEADLIVMIGRNSKVYKTANPKCQYIDMSTFKKKIESKEMFEV